MAIKTKSAQEVAQKWGEVTPSRQQYYVSGAQGAGQEWENKTLEAAANFQAAVTAGNIGKMFQGGVKQAGASKYQRKVAAVGGERFASGVNAGKQDYATGIAPMLETISGLTLPARAPRGSESNLARVRAVAVALHQKRLALRAAGA
jgi:hypothetical protein